MKRGKKTSSVLSEELAGVHVDCFIPFEPVIEPVQYCIISVHTNRTKWSYKPRRLASAPNQSMPRDNVATKHVKGVSFEEFFRNKLGLI